MTPSTSVTTVKEDLSVVRDVSMDSGKQEKGSDKERGSPATLETEANDPDLLVQLERLKSKAEKRRLEREKETPEERAERLRRRNEYERARRANETKEEREARRMKRRERRQHETPEERELRLKQRNEYDRMIRSSTVSPDNSKRNMKDRERRRNESEEEREERRRKRNEKDRLRRQQETPEQREKRRLERNLREKRRRERERNSETGSMQGEPNLDLGAHHVAVSPGKEEHKTGTTSHENVQKKTSDQVPSSKSTESVASPSVPIVSPPQAKKQETTSVEVKATLKEPSSSQVVDGLDVESTEALLSLASPRTSKKVDLRTVDI